MDRRTFLKLGGAAVISAEIVRPQSAQAAACTYGEGLYGADTYGSTACAPTSVSLHEVATQTRSPAFWTILAGSVMALISVRLLRD